MGMDMDMDVNMVVDKRLENTFKFKFGIVFAFDMVCAFHMVCTIDMASMICAARESLQLLTAAWNIAVHTVHTVFVFVITVMLV